VEAWLPFGLNKSKWAQRTYRPARETLKEFIKDSLSLALIDYKKQLHEYEQQGVPEKERMYQSVAGCALASGKYHPDNFDLTNDLLSLTFAGYDTTAHTLAFAFAEIAQNPELQDQLFQQVRSILGPPPVSPQTITAEKISQIPLVTAVYREALRKYPAVVFIPVHVNRDIAVEGHVVPAGAEVWCNVRGVQMNPTIFPNPEKFDPSRYIVPENAKSKYSSFDNFSATNAHKEITSENQYNFPDLAFTLGQHSCMGKNLSILELRTVIAYTMNQFTCKLKEGSVIDTMITLTTKPRHGVRLYFERRT
jgi:cytochrome P450